MGGLEVKANNAAEFRAALEAAVARALAKIGMAAEGYAKGLCPVDTGRLRDSITNQAEGPGKVVVGTNVEYGPYVELGTSRMKARPYLKPAATEHASEYRAILEGELRKG